MQKNAISEIRSKVEEFQLWFWKMTCTYVFTLCCTKHIHVHEYVHTYVCTDELCTSTTGISNGENR